MGDFGFYNHVMSNVGFATGIGDWFFRPAAFPRQADNVDEYLSLYYADEGSVARSVRRCVEEKRGLLTHFLTQVVDQTT